MNLDLLIRACQSKVGVEKIDGKPGPATWQAIYERLYGHSWVVEPPPSIVGDPVDARSEGVIATLHPKVQPYARALVLAALDKDFDIKIISGLRSYAEQDALYAQGRTKPGVSVTKARGGYSNHNFGIAFDVGVFVADKYMEDSPIYKAVGALGMNLGLEWGGNWHTIEDQPHFQLRPYWAGGMGEGDMLTSLRFRKSQGEDFFA